MLSGKNGRLRIASVGMFVATAVMLAGTAQASAATLTVCESGPPKCGYSHIQEAVNAASSGDTIAIAAGTYNLAPGEVFIDKTLTLHGAGAARTIISGEEVGVGAFPHGAPADVVTITGVTIANGFGVTNASIHDAGETTLTLNSSVVKNNAVNNGSVFNTGVLTLNNTTVSDNSATESGGGIENLERIDSSGTVTLNNSTVSDNSAGKEGGGIYNSSGTVTLHNSTVGGNSAANGGGIYNGSGTVTLHNSTVSSNSAALKGGGIYNKATLVGSNDTIAGNTAPEGAGIFNEPPGEVNLKNSNVQSP